MGVLWGSRNPYEIQVNTKVGMDVHEKNVQEMTGRNPYEIQVNTKAQKDFTMAATINFGRNPYEIQVNTKGPQAWDPYFQAS